MSTGDTTDNHETVELDWYLSVMSGGRITPNTGLQTKWYAIFGNHDDSIEGTLPSATPILADMYTGGLKFTGFDNTSANLALRSSSGGDSMNNLLLAPDRLEIRHSGSALVSTLQRYPNVVAWVNGHTHDNKITPHHHDDPTRSFWEINTASQVDFPQHARIIEVCDNRDGSLSLFTTLVESAAPYQAAYDDGSQSAPASLYRELSYNDIHRDPARIGTTADRNTELLLKNPLA